MSLVNRFKDRLRNQFSRRHQRPSSADTTSASIIDDNNTPIPDGDENAEVEERDLTFDNNRQSLPSTNDTSSMTTTRRRIGRPPSPYPPSESSRAYRSSSIDQRLPSSSAPLSSRRHTIGTSFPGTPSRADLDAYSPPEAPMNQRSPWVQRTLRKYTWLKDLPSHVVVTFKKPSHVNSNNKSNTMKCGFKGVRRQSSPPLEASSLLAPNGGGDVNEDAARLHDSETEDMDLRYFYDPSSEDPVNRLMFTSGPEHFHHLALQLETSPLTEFQLYGKDLFIRAADLGYAPAQFKLGICFELGLTHFPMDPEQSFAWYKRAAMQGHADAELAVSGWYLTGHPQGLIQSEPLAYEWASKAARRGWSKAEYTLGHYHEVGIGVPQDLALAKQWYIKAAVQGNERALLRLLVGHVGLDVDYAHLKDELLNQNQDNPYLIHQLAQFHELREYGLVPDDDAAFELYAASAQAHYAPAQYKLGACYEFGILGCPQDPVQAVRWYSQGAENGHVEALLALAGFYLDGSAGNAAEQSDEEAFRFVKAAAQRGVPKAEYITGFFLEYGLGVEKNLREAKRWYHLACAKGVDSAEKRLKDLEKVAATTAGESATTA